MLFLGLPGSKRKRKTIRERERLRKRKTENCLPRFDKIDRSPNKTVSLRLNKSSPEFSLKVAVTEVRSHENVQCMKTRTNAHTKCTDEFSNIQILDCKLTVESVTE